MARELFRSTSLFDVIEERKRSARARVDQIPRDQFLNTAEEAVLEHVLAGCEFAPLVLHPDRASRSVAEAVIRARRQYPSPFDGATHIEVPGVIVTVEIPFEGDVFLWQCQPNTFSSVAPRGEIRNHGSAVVLTLECRASDPPERTKQALDNELRVLEQYVSWQAMQISTANREIADQIRDAVVQRRARLLDQAKLEAVLGIPLKRDPGAPLLDALPLARRLVRPLPAAPKASFAPEWAVTDEDYEHILSVIRHEGRTFEAIPKTFAKFDEEELRDVLLAHLNGHYLGGATGETFRGAGKTDVRIEAENRAAFVAECKVWSGPKRALDACDQLLAYLTWRDCKAALIFFNKSVSEFGEILTKLAPTFASHSAFRSRMPLTHAAEWRFRMASSTDSSREVIVHVFLLNLFVLDRGHVPDAALSAAPPHPSSGLDAPHAGTVLANKTADLVATATASTPGQKPKGKRSARPRSKR